MGRGQGRWGLWGVVVLSLWLWWGPSLGNATAIYDYSVEAHLTFNVPWQSMTISTVPLLSGTGLHQEQTNYWQTVAHGNLGITQGGTINGSAGDGMLTISGRSQARIDVYTYFTFDFGMTPVDFVLTFTDYDFRLTSTKELPWNGTGEFVGGSGGIQLLFDDFGGAWYTKGKANILPQVTGVHTVRLWTGVESTAIAEYPYLVPESSATVLLALSLGLLGGWQGWRYCRAGVPRPRRAAASVTHLSTKPPS